MEKGIYGVGGGVYRGNCLKRGGTWTVCRCKGGRLDKKDRVVFSRCGGGGVGGWYPNAHYEALNTLQPLYIDGVQWLKAMGATTRSHFTFYHQVPRRSWHSLDWSRRDERLSWPLSHPVVLSSGALDRNSSALTTLGHFSIRSLGFHEQPVYFFNVLF